MFVSPRLSTLRALLLAAATVTSLGCGDDPSPTSTGAGSGAAGVGASSGGGGAGASSGTSGQSGAGAAPGSCVPGIVNVCPCAASSGEGVQTCQANGTFGSCEGCSGGEGGSDTAGGSGGGSQGGAGSGGAGAGGKGGAGGAGGKGGAGGAAGTPPCNVESNGNPCGDCIVKNCCEVATDCFADATCEACLGAQAPAGCEQNAAYKALDQCSFAACQAECYATPSKYPCEGAEEVVYQGKITGYVRCSDGRLVRREVLECPTKPYVPYPTSCASGGECVHDAECTAGLEGRCQSIGDFCGCFYNPSPCAKDGDCGAGKICVCGDTSGHCESALCTSSDDCAVGDCVESSSCTGNFFTCQTAQDTCGSSDDCKGNSNGPSCWAQGGKWGCAPGFCEGPVP